MLATVLIAIATAAAVSDIRHHQNEIQELKQEVRELRYINHTKE